MYVKKMEDYMFIFISILFIFLIWTICNSLFMPKLVSYTHMKKNPLVSILIPLRNEENNVPHLVSSLKNLTYSNIDIILLDDQSTDSTKTIIEGLIKNDSRFTLVEGSTLPSGWTGKVHACYQLSRYARGDYFLFLDADIRLHQDTIQIALSTLKRMGGKLLTGFPKFPVTLFLEKLLVPMQHFIIYFHLPLLLANYTKFSAASAAHGSFMLFERNAYETIGGHSAIKDSLLDDVHLARKMKKKGEKVVLANITQFVSCYMYSSNRDVWEGFKKNIFVGIGRSVFMASFLIIFYLIFYVSPVVFILYGVFEIIYYQHLNLYRFLPYIIIVIQKWFIDFQSKQKPTLSFFIPASAIAFISLLIVSMGSSLRNKGYHWKGRTYQ